MERAHEELGKISRWIAVLWIVTSLSYAFHPLAALPLVHGFDSSFGKWPMVLLQCGVMVGVLLRPSRSAALIVAALVSLAALIAWHSWLGGYQPFVPFVFLWLAAARRMTMAERESSLAETLILAFIATGLRSFNTAYLSGAEFAEGGALSHLLPQALSHLPGFYTWSLWVWLTFTSILPTFILASRFQVRAVGLVCFAVASVLFRPVLYAGFLVWPLIFACDSKTRPAILASLSLITFFVWYEFATQSWWPFAIAFAFFGLACFGATLRAPTWSYQWPTKNSRVRLAWITLWLAYIVLPSFIDAWPAPFGATQYTARPELRPASKQEVWPQSCASIHASYALRWGYKLQAVGPEACSVTRYF